MLLPDPEDGQNEEAEIHVSSVSFLLPRAGLPSAAAERASPEERTGAALSLPQTGVTDVPEAGTGAAFTPGFSSWASREEQSAREGAFLSGAMTGLRRAAARASRQAVDTPSTGAGQPFAPATEQAADPVLLVDAAFRRDARRYDGALGLL